MELANHIELETAMPRNGLEEQRLQALHSYAIYDTPAEASFDSFTRWLGSLLHVPSVVISFVGEHQVAIKSSFGFPERHLPRCDTFCHHTIQSAGILIVPDALEDPRFYNSPLVTRPNGIRFYAAAPLVTPAGFRIGAVCAIDHCLHPDFGAPEADTLREIAGAVMRELESRRVVSNLMFQQELNTAIADARDFQTALETVLRRAGERLGASYCIMPQQCEDPATFRMIAGVAIKPEFQPVISRGLETEKWDIAQFPSRTVLTEQRVVDTGLLTPETIGPYGEFGAAFFALGMRRQISIPLNLGTRRAAIMAGFNRGHLASTDQDFLAGLVTKLVPLLLGRLREEESHRGRKLMNYANRAMRTLIGANQALASASTELGLIQTICQVAVTQGGYDAAWVGFAENDARHSIRVVARWGQHVEQLEEIPLTWADNGFGQGVSGTAIRENRVAAIHNIARDPRLGLFRKYPALSLFGSCIAIPLRTANGSVLGVFTLYNTVRAEGETAGQLSFDHKEKELLTELARDIVNGINLMRIRTERNEALKKQQASDARFADLLASSPAVLFALEHQRQGWRCVEMTPNFERVFGHPNEDAKTDGWWEAHLHPDDLPVTQATMQRLTEDKPEVAQFRLADKSGGYRWIRAELAYRPANGEAAPRIIGSWFDITEKQEAQNEIHRLAFYDQLTGLANRQLLQDQIEKTVLSAHRHGSHNALLFIDLDRFKAINDAHGHATGDEVLVAVAKRLRRGLRASDTVARLGGDEFVVLLPKLALDSHEATTRARTLAEKIIASIDRPITQGELTLRVTASVGIYVFSGQDHNMEKILRCADMAMYTAKSITKKQAWSWGHSNISVFESAMQDMVAQYHAIQSEVKRALAEDRLELWLQPQVDAKGATIGAEGLIRLHRTDGVLIQPNDFITAAEETGLIVPIGQWVRTQACRLLAKFPPAQLPRLSVNVSAVEFHQPHIVEDIGDLLRRSETDPSRLVLEITENLLIDRLDETIEKLEKLAAIGVGISIDDFGTGYSSLAYLQRLPITEIKIDKRFIHDMLIDRRSADLTQSLIMLGQNFGFSVVAEGVETQAQANFLRHHGCQYMQGYHFGAPTPTFTPVTTLNHEAAGV